MRNKEIAQTTVEAMDRGSYTAPSGTEVNITSLMQHCVQNTVYFLPDQLADVRETVSNKPGGYQKTDFEVVNETTIEGCTRLILTDPSQQIAALNFASAKNPGGGFLSGAQAQEESLARSSGLYYSLRQCPDFYAFHRAQTTLLYSDRMIYSAACPIFRDDDGNWLETPYLVDFITSPAPNAGAIQTSEPESTAQIEPVLRERTSKVLALAASRQCDTLILGAWGCGVFRNDPVIVADTFYDLLKPDSVYQHRFQKVLFSVYDRSKDQRTLQAFTDRFASV